MFWQPSVCPRGGPQSLVQGSFPPSGPMSFLGVVPQSLVPGCFPASGPMSFPGGYPIVLSLVLSKVLFQVLPWGGGGLSPVLLEGAVHSQDKGYLQTTLGQDRGYWTWWGYPLPLDRIGGSPPGQDRGYPPCQESEWCYAVGGTPLTVTQKDFFVHQVFASAFDSRLV